MNRKLFALVAISANLATPAFAGNEGPASAILLHPFDSSTVGLVDAIAQNRAAFDQLMQYGSVICGSASGSKVVPPSPGFPNRLTITDYKVTVCQKPAGGAPPKATAALSIEDRATFGVDLVTHSYTSSINEIDPGASGAQDASTRNVSGAPAAQLMGSLLSRLDTPGGPQVSVKSVDCLETDMGPGGKSATCTLKVTGNAATTLAEALKGAGVAETVTNPETVELNINDLSCLSMITPGPQGQGQGKTSCSFQD